LLSTTAIFSISKIAGSSVTGPSRHFRCDAELVAYRGHADMERFSAGNDLQQLTLTGAHKLAAGPTIAYRYAKTLINTAVANGVSAADVLTVEATPQTFDTEDMRNTTKRFAELGPRKFRDGLEFKGR
jgi:hypothetical protein